MSTATRRACPELVDLARAKNTAIALNRSAEPLFGYLSRLDQMRAAGCDLGREALAERAAEAELHMRMLLSAGMDSFNELHDLGLLEDSLRTTARDHAAFNAIKLVDAVKQMAVTFRDQMPEQNWDWLETASKLVEGVEVRVEGHGNGMRAKVTHSGQTRDVHLGIGLPASRLSTADFFSPGPARVYVPTSAIFASANKTAEPVAAYDAAVGGMAFAREWVYRHARNAAELGIPARTGGGPVLVVVAIVILVVAIVAAVAAIVATVICFLGSDAACKWAAVFGTLASILTGANETVVKPNATQNPSISYGTNPQ